MRAIRTPLLFLVAIGSAGGVTAPALAVPGRAAKPDASNDTAAIADAIRAQGGSALHAVYAERDFAPLWVAKGRIGPQADALVAFLDSADLDGLKPGRYGVERLREAIARARDTADPALTARAELMLSDAFTRYARDMRKPPRIDMLYADPAVKPRKLKPDALLRAAVLTRDFPDYIAQMGWMSPHYLRMRRLLAGAARAGRPEAELDRIRLNRERARILPGPWVHHIVVDAAAGRLYYYQTGAQAGTMKVVVGAAETQTPMLAGMVNWAILNPYWNVPTYLAQRSIAPKILSGRSLKSMNMEALSDWSENARPLDPKAIDWPAIASGTQEIRLRELPGPANSMGRVKFLFPNDEGIYLHDTPDRQLFTKPDRHLSNGCVRLEDAPRLGKWLLGRAIPAVSSKKPEQATALPVPVPVYLTYFTATAVESGDGIAFLDDVYGRDAKAR